MKRELIGLALLVALVALAGCSSTGLDPQDAINESSSVQGAELVYNEYQEPTLKVDLREPVLKGDQTCNTRYSPALGQPVTECSTNWHAVEVNSVQVEQVNGSFTDRHDYETLSMNGETILTTIPRENATYRYHMESANSPNTWFQIRVEWTGENWEIVSAGYHDTY